MVARWGGPAYTRASLGEVDVRKAGVGSRSAAGVRTRVILPKVFIMSKDVYYLQRCPVCGRMLQIRVNLLGQQVYCQHCGGGFVAVDEPLHPAGDSHAKSTADRAEELLERAALVLQQATFDGEF